LTTLYGYVLVRTDLPSLGHGKAVAHSFHAGNHLTWTHVVEPLQRGEEPNADLVAWHHEGKGFGTAIALGDKRQMDLATMRSVVDTAKQLGMIADLIVDPTYPYLVDVELAPLLDPSIHTTPMVSGPPGFMVAFRREITTAYVFGDKDQLRPLLSKFSLYPND